MEVHDHVRHDIRPLQDSFYPGSSEAPAATKPDIQDLRFDLCGLRNELTALSKEMGGLRQDLGDLRFDLLRWSLAFWIAQVLAVAGAVMGLRLIGG